MSNARILILLPDDPCNCMIVDQANEETCYTVSTVRDFRHATTHLRDKNDNLLASWKWESSASDSNDILTMGDSEPRPASEWLRRSSLPFKTQV
jgi:hypothetical protein